MKADKITKSLSLKFGFKCPVQAGKHFIVKFIEVTVKMLLSKWESGK